MALLVGIDIWKDAPLDTLVSIGSISTPIFCHPNNLPRTDGETDIFFSPTLRTRPGNNKEDVYGTQVLWVDVDSTERPRPTFSPSAIVFSGGGWHLYWLLDGYCLDTEQIEGANKVLMEDVEGDHCWNVNRLLRVPGTINSKYSTLCELKGSSPGCVYKIEDFKVLKRLDSKARHKIRTGDRRGYKSRSERDWAIIESLIACGADDRLIELLFSIQPCGDKYAEAGLQYLQHTIEQVKEKSVSLKKARRQYGDISIGGDGFYVERSRGVQRLSTFTMTPTLLLQGDNEDALICDVAANGFVWKDIAFPRSAFNDRKQFDKHLRISAWVWLGKDDDVRALLPWLLERLQAVGLPRARATSVLGRHEEYFVTNETTFSGTEVFTGKDSPLVFLETRREKPVIKVTDAAPDLTHLLSINTPEVIWPALGWYMATPYKPSLEKRNVRFPVLNVYGTKGSGKTSMIKTMQRLLGYETPTTYNCTTTQFVILALLGGTNALPVAFSEFRAAAAEKFLRFILLAYDTGHDPRGRADQSTVDYPLSAPFSVDGEDIIADAAAKERIVAVNLHPSSIEEGSTAFKAFRLLRDQPLEGFAPPYYQFTLRRDIQVQLARAQEVIAKVFPEVLPDRVRNNLMVSLFGMMSFSDFTNTQLPENLRCVLEPVLKAVWSPLLGRSMTLADEFVEYIVNTAALKHAGFFHVVEKGVMWFQLATAFQSWLRVRRGGGQQSLDRDAIRTQLIERDVGTGGKGQYVILPKIVQGTWCYGVDLEAAHASGLDIPDHIDFNTLQVTF